MLAARIVVDMAPVVVASGGVVAATALEYELSRLLTKEERLAL